MGCQFSGKEWTRTCQGTEWVGEIGTCPEGQYNLGTSYLIFCSFVKGILHRKLILLLLNIQVNHKESSLIIESESFPKKKKHFAIFITVYQSRHINKAHFFSGENREDPSLTLPLGVLIAIIIGIALIIGVLILTVGLVCLKRYVYIRAHSTWRKYWFSLS